jgi:hypothetical protein
MVKDKKNKKSGGVGVSPPQGNFNFLNSFQNSVAPLKMEVEKDIPHGFRTRGTQLFKGRGRNKLPQLACPFIRILRFG